MKLIVIYETIFLFWTSFNVTFMTTTIVERSLKTVATSLFYNMHKSQTYWGVFLTLTNRQKYKICEDILKPNSWPITDIDGGDSMSFPLSISKLKIEGQRTALGSVISFNCRGIDRKKDIIEETISHGYIRNTFFGSLKLTRNALLRSFFIGTPAFIIQPTPDLEQFYYDARLQIENLRLESPDYIKLVETKGDIFSLLGPQKLQLCTEVFQSPYYEWRKVAPKKNGTLVKVTYKSVPLIFKKSKLESGRFHINVMICEVNLLDDKKQTLGLIQSYNHYNSVYVVAGVIDEIYLDVYVKNIVGLTL